MEHRPASPEPPGGHGGREPGPPGDPGGSTPWIRRWLRAEGFAAFALGLVLWRALGGEWPWFLVAIFLPDLSMMGYLRGPHLGAIAYNLAHNWFVGGLVLAVGLWLSVVPLALAGAVLVAHTGMDRVMGYGLKYPTGFTDTHLGRIGRKR